MLYFTDNLLRIRVFLLDFSVCPTTSFQNIEKWKNANIILSNYPILIYKRPGFEIKEPLPASISVVNAPLLEISSTIIRYMIKNKKNIRYLVPDIVKDEIEINRFYSSSLENPTEE